jgi:hypothetical protein
MMVNKIGFYTGIILILAAAILLLGNFLGDSAFPIILGIMGITLIGTSKYRPLKRQSILKGRGKYG